MITEGVNIQACWHVTTRLINRRCLMLGQFKISYDNWRVVLEFVGFCSWITVPKHDYSKTLRALDNPRKLLVSVATLQRCSFLVAQALERAMSNAHLIMSNELKHFRIEIVLGFS